MARLFTQKMHTTYSTPQNVIIAVEKTGLADIRYMIAVDTTNGRFFPVFVGQDAIDRGVIFHGFAVVG